MTDDEYFDDHLPHRVNLLLTFRERYGPTPSRPGFSQGEPRDFYRCAKDISILMVRFFCSEMGLCVPRRAKGVPCAVTNYHNWSAYLATQIFSEADAKADARYPRLLAVLIAANRAVAHLEELDVDHPIKTEADCAILVEAITWIEELIESHIYAPNGRSLATAMDLPHNVM